MDANRFDRIAKLLADRRTSRRAAAKGGLAVAALGLGFNRRADAQEATPSTEAAAQGVGPNGEELDLLFVQSFSSGSLAPKDGEDGAYTLALSGGASTLWFSDRPNRYVGTVPTARFVSELGPAFESDPPNAALVVARPPSATDGAATPEAGPESAPDLEDIYVVELSNPVTDQSGGITYDVRILGESEAGMGFTEAAQAEPTAPLDLGDSHLFIDDIICGDHHIQCCIGSNVVPNSDLGSHCFHWSVAGGGCLPCAGGHYESYTEQCNANFASACNGNCWANRSSEGC